MSDAPERPTVIQVPSLPLLVAVLALVVLPAAAVIVASGGGEGLKGLLAAKADPAPKEKADEKKDKDGKKAGPVPAKGGTVPALLCLREGGSYTTSQAFNQEVESWVGSMHARIAAGGDVAISRGRAMNPAEKEMLDEARKAKVDYVLGQMNYAHDGEASVRLNLLDVASGKALWKRDFSLGRTVDVTRKHRDEVVMEVGAAVRRAMGLPPAPPPPPQAVTPPAPDTAAIAKEVLALLRPEVAKLTPATPDVAGEVRKLLPEVAKAVEAAIKKEAEATPRPADAPPIVVVFRPEVEAGGDDGARIRGVFDHVQRGARAELDAAGLVGTEGFGKTLEAMFKSARALKGDAMIRTRVFQDEHQDGRPWVTEVTLTRVADGRTLSLRKAIAGKSSEALRPVKEIAAEIVAPAIRLLSTPKSSAPPAADALAVLPFTATGPVKDAAGKWVDEIPMSLLRGEAARLVPPRRVKALGAVADPLAAGKALRARIVLHGEVKAEGKSITVDVRLIDAEDDLILWSERYWAAEEADPAAYLRKTGEDIAAAVGKRLSAIRKR